MEKQTNQEKDNSNSEEINKDQLKSVDQQQNFVKEVDSNNATSIKTESTLKSDPQSPNTLE